MCSVADVHDALSLYGLYNQQYPEVPICFPEKFDCQYLSYLFPFIITKVNASHLKLDVSRMTGVTKATVYAHINKLLKEKIIKKSKKVGKTQLYQLNYDNPKAKIILMLERFIVSERLGKLIEKEDTCAIHRITGSAHTTKAAEHITV